MLRKYFVPCMVASLAMVVLAGCGGEKGQIEPYAEGTLQQLTRGPVIVSKGYRYKLVQPNIVEAAGHLALVKEGNIVEFVVGRSIEDRLETMNKPGLILNVVKKYQPFIHFKVQQIVNGTDTVFVSQAGAINFPTITPVAEHKSEKHDDYDIDKFPFNRTAQLNKTRDKSFALKGSLVRVEEDGEEVWMLQGDKATLRMTAPANGEELILRLLYKSGMEFEGGVTVTEIEEWSKRRENEISATVELDYVKWGDMVFSG